MQKPDSLLRIDCDDLQQFFKLWFKFLEPLHHLTDREVDVLACLCKYRYLLGKKIMDDEILDNVLFSEDTKKKIIEDLGMSLQYYQVIISKLRKINLLKEGHIEPRIVPNLKEDRGNYTLMLNFIIKDNA